MAFYQKTEPDQVTHKNTSFKCKTQKVTHRRAHAGTGTDHLFTQSHKNANGNKALTAEIDNLLSFSSSFASVKAAAPVSKVGTSCPVTQGLPKAVL